MSLVFSPGTLAFYDTTMNASIPTDAVEITSEVHASILAAQGMGQIIIAGAAGQPATAAPPAPPAPTLAQQAAAAISQGLTITLSGTITLAATVFPTDPATQAKLGTVSTIIIKTGAFPGGATTYPMKDAAGAWHTFTVAQYEIVAAAIAAYVAPLDLIIDGNPLNATALPAASVSLTV